LGLCFGFCLLVVKLGYSMVLGAFLIGAIMAESTHHRKIERLVEPLRDMFSAIFFVAIGLMIEPRVLVEYAVPIAVITAAVVIGKVVSCSLGAFLAGNDGRTSLRVGMGLSQIGEFSFIIAALGMTLEVTSDFLYPVAVAVSAITTLLTPYLIRAADPFALMIGRRIPSPLARVFSTYGEWLRNIRLQGETAAFAAIVRRILMHTFVNLALVIAIFFTCAHFAPQVGQWLSSWITGEEGQKGVLCALALLLSMPFLIAAYRKLGALSLLLAQAGVKPQFAGRHTDTLRQVMAQVIPVVFLGVILFLLAALSASILPTREMLVLVAVVVVIFAALFWRWLIRIHARMQAALVETLETPSASSDH